jgi:hypothetical protein
MGGGRVPGPLDAAKTEAIDGGTLNRQASPVPGSLGILRHRYDKPWEVSSNRKLLEFNRDPGTLSAAERLRGHRLGGEYYSNHLTAAEVHSWFEGFSLPRRSAILLLPNPHFQATPWEQAFGLTFVSSHPPSYPIVNASYEVVGHVASVRNDEVLVPRRFASLNLSDLVDSGVPAFVRNENPNSRFWMESSSPQIAYQLVTTPGGEVVAVLSARDRDGVGSQSTGEFILTVVSLVDGYYLVRAAASAVGRAALSRLDRWLAQRAKGALGRERLEAAGKAAVRGKDVSPAAFERTQPQEAFDPTVPGSAGITRNSGDFAAASAESNLEKRFGAMNQESLAEIEKARAARGSASAGVDPSLGDDWMEEVAQIIDRVERKHFPKGVPLD